MLALVGTEGMTTARSRRQTLNARIFVAAVLAVVVAHGVVEVLAFLSND